MFRRGVKGIKGQVMSEYAMMLVMFAVVSITLLLLLACFTEYGYRLVHLVSVHDEVDMDGWSSGSF